MSLVQRLIEDPLLADVLVSTAHDTPAEAAEASRLENLQSLVRDPQRLREVIAANIEKQLWHPGQRKRKHEEVEGVEEEEYPKYQVVAVPDGYPTHPQEVKLLAELYYLTQTLPLTKLLPSSHKVLMTDNFELALLEGKIAVLYLRIEELKRQGKWSLRQPQRHYDPFTYVKKNKKKEFHWDWVVREGEWMAEDFKQGVRWKKACCVEIARAIKAYHRGEDVTIKTRKPALALKESSRNPVLYLDPETDLSKNDSTVLRSLPKYTSFCQDSSAYLLLKHMELPLVPVLRLIHPTEENNDWFNLYTRTEEEDDLETLNIEAKEAKMMCKGSPFGNVRRFTPLKPPKPPLVKNIEFRTPTIWLPQDDKLLIHYIAEFGFNWDLILEHLQGATLTALLKLYQANIERRTPWQCFERYIQLNENFQFLDMKGMYNYHAQQWLEQAHKQQLTTKRRISPLGVGLELIQRGHRRLRWALMFDAMRKLIKKREDTARDRLNLQRKASEVTAQQANKKQLTNDRVATPAELSKLKYENDKSIRKAYIDQRATRNEMAAAVKGGGNGPTAAGPPATVSTTGTNPQLSAPPSAQPSGANTPRAQSQPPQQGMTPVPQQTPLRVPPGYTPEQFQQMIALRRKNTPTPSLTPVPTAGMAGAMPASALVQQTPTKRLQFAPAQVTAIINLIQQKHPNLSKEQVTKYAAQYLATLQQQQSNRAVAQAQQSHVMAPTQSTLQAAMAQGASPRVIDPGATPTPQQLIQQQQRQQRARQQAAVAAQQQQSQRQQMLPHERQVMMQMQMQMRQHQQLMGMPPQSPYDDKTE